MFLTPATNTCLLTRKPKLNYCQITCILCACSPVFEQIDKILFLSIVLSIRCVLLAGWFTWSKWMERLQLCGLRLTFFFKIKLCKSWFIWRCLVFVLLKILQMLIRFIRNWGQLLIMLLELLRYVLEGKCKLTFFEWLEWNIKQYLCFWKSRVLYDSKLSETFPGQKVFWGLWLWVTWVTLR